MKEEDYSIEFLAKKFESHAKEFEKNLIEQTEKHPDIHTDNFNLPLALSIICKEIKKLSHRSEND